MGTERKYGSQAASDSLPYIIIMKRTYEKLNLNLISKPRNGKSDTYFDQNFS